VIEHRLRNFLVGDAMLLEEVNSILSEGYEVLDIIPIDD